MLFLKEPKITKEILDFDFHRKWALHEARYKDAYVSLSNLIDRLNGFSNNGYWDGRNMCAILYAHIQFHTCGY